MKGGLNITTTYTYDDLHRPTARTYNDGTPGVRWMYDRPCAKGIGRLCSVVTSESEMAFSFDGAGRIVTSQQTTGGTAYQFAYQYNLAGGLTGMTYPSGRQVNYGRDARNRVTSVSRGITSYASGIQWTPQQTLAQVSLGSGLTQQWCHYDRLQVTALRLGAGSVMGCAARVDDVLRLEYSYEAGMNNGSVASQRVVVPRAGGPLDRTQVYGYDSYGRISRMDEGSEFRVFQYDTRNNLFVGGTSVSMSPGSFTPRDAGWFDAQNRLVNAGLGIQYDVGNLTGIGAQTLTYDAENRLRTFKLNGVTTTFVYDAQGNLAAEYGAQTGSAGVRYLATDGLGSTRVVTDGNGAVLERFDYYPFGDPIPAGVGGRATSDGYLADETAAGVKQRFTGKERDAETGLDCFEARYFSSAQGRFTSPDVPFADQWEKDPQSWNLYAYARNNPLRFVDPTGRACVVGPDGKEHDDDSGGQSCAEAHEADKKKKPDITVTDNPLPMTWAQFADPPRTDPSDGRSR